MIINDDEIIKRRYSLSDKELDEFKKLFLIPINEFKERDNRFFFEKNTIPKSIIVKIIKEDLP